MISDGFDPPLGDELPTALPWDIRNLRAVGQV